MKSERGPFSDSLLMVIVIRLTHSDSQHTLYNQMLENSHMEGRKVEMSK
jgi:hypothetical protein